MFTKTHCQPPGTASPTHLLLRPDILQVVLESTSVLNRFDRGKLPENSVRSNFLSLQALERGRHVCSVRKGGIFNSRSGRNRKRMGAYLRIVAQLASGVVVAHRFLPRPFASIGHWVGGFLKEDSPRRLLVMRSCGIPSAVPRVSGAKRIRWVVGEWSIPLEPFLRSWVSLRKGTRLLGSPMLMKWRLRSPEHPAMNAQLMRLLQSRPVLCFQLQRDSVHYQLLRLRPRSHRSLPTPLRPLQLLECPPSLYLNGTPLHCLPASSPLRFPSFHHPSPSLTPSPASL